MENSIGHDTRLGTSRLANRLLSEVVGEEVKFF